MCNTKSLKDFKTNATISNSLIFYNFTTNKYENNAWKWLAKMTMCKFKSTEISKNPSISIKNDTLER